MENFGRLLKLANNSLSKEINYLSLQWEACSSRPYGQWL